MTATLDFHLPGDLEAREPAEAHGRRRDDVRLLVSSGVAVSHHRFRELPRLLEPGDLLVVNNSATLPAALDAGPGLVVHVSTERADGSWLVEPRRRVGGTTTPLDTPPHDTTTPLDSTTPLDTTTPLDGPAPWTIAIPEGRLTLRERFTDRLWIADADVPGTMVDYLARHGRPIRYSYTDRDWPLETYQNSYSVRPGSAEMPSAGRPLTGRVLAELAGRGVLVAPITLHTGVASAEVDEPPYPEWFEIPQATAELIRHVRAAGGRVVAVGTTVVRALESTGGAAGSGWTDLVIGPEHRVRVVDGLLTGLHEPRASHLRMLTAIAGEEALRAAYAEALRGRYMWHEFGDVHLILSGARPASTADAPDQAGPAAPNETGTADAPDRAAGSGAHHRGDGDAGGSQRRDEAAEDAGHYSRDDAGHAGLPGKLHVVQEWL
jgi:S-adenosylmethionine:tRNA ribosyltransferase-isomerase